MSDHDVFSVRHAEIFQRKAILTFKNYDFLYTRAADDIRERLKDIKRDFIRVLLCGFYTPMYFAGDFPHAVMMADIAPERFAAIAGQFDLILTLGELHRANDLPGVLVQMRRALKPDGVMMAAFAGGETLHELRASLLQGEIAATGGASPRVFPFADSQQIAGLMQRAGYSLPVVDSDVMEVLYRDLFHVMDDVRGMGEANSLAARSMRFTRPAVFAEASGYYQKHFAEAGGKIRATFEIIHVIGWSPHDSQQKPAKRGSGQVSLSEIL